MTRDDSSSDDLASEFDACLLQYDQARRDGSADRAHTLGPAADDPELAEALDAIDLLWGVWQPPSVAATDRGRSDETGVGGRAVDGPSDPPHPEVLGDYRLVREIGRGGMGVVYEAEQLSLGRSVALKLRGHTHLLNRHQQTRFENEARAVANLEHPHIVSVYGVGVEQGLHYFAMQLVEGCSLADAIQTIQSRGDASQKPDEADADDDATNRQCIGLVEAWERSQAEYFREVARLGIQAAEALNHAHENDVIHRDVKPANLLLDQSGELLVADFGLAHVEADITMTGSGDLLGTLQYMSPEQATSSPLIDRRTDVYGLAASLYDLVTLRPPFEDPRRHELLSQVISAQPPRPRHLNPPLPVDLETIILKGLAKEPGERYQTTRELGKDLVRFLEHRPILARRPSVATRLAKVLARHRVVAIAGSAILLVVLISITALVLTFNRTLARQNRELREKAYASDMRIGFDAWRNLQYDLLAEILARYEPGQTGEDLRTFAWHFLRRQLTQPLWTTKAHDGKAWDVDYSPDGRLLATCGEDGQVQILDVATGTVAINSASYSHDGPALKVRFADRAVVSIGNDGRLALSPAIGNAQPVRLIDVAKVPLTSLAISPNGSLAIVGDQSGTIHVVELPDLKIIAVLNEHTDAVRTIAFARHANRFATGGDDRMAIVWDLSDLTVVSRLPHDVQPLVSRVHGIAFTSDDSQLITLAREQRIICLWDIAAQALLTQDDVEIGDVLLDLTPSAKVEMLAVASKSGVGTLLSPGFDWDFPTHREFYVHPSRMHAVSLDEDYSRVAAALSSGHVAAWDVEQLHSSWQHIAAPEDYLDVAISAHGRWLATVDATSRVDVWNAGTGDHQFAFRVADPSRRQGVLRLEMSEFDDYIAVAGTELTHLEVWDVAAHKRVVRLPVASTCSAAISPCGTKIATTNDNCAQIWDLPTGNLIHTISTELASHDVEFSPDGKWLVVRVSPRDLAVFDAATWRQQSAITTEHGYSRWEFTANGDQLILAHERGYCSVWDLKKRKRLRSAVGHTDRVTGIALDSDGSLLASVSLDDTLRLTDLRTCQEVARFPAKSATGVAMSPDGQILAYLSKDPHGDVRKLRVLSAPPIGRAHIRFAQRPKPSVTSDGFPPTTRFDDAGQSVACDGRGSVYLAGQLGTRGGGAFLSRFDRQGHLRWTTRIGASDSWEATGVEADREGHVYLTGLAKYPGTEQATRGNRDSFLACFDNRGSCQWIQANGTEASEVAAAINLDDQGGVFFAGAFEGNRYVGHGPGHLSVARYAASGTPLWGRNYGTTQREQSRDVCVGPAGSVYLTGWTAGDMAGPSAGQEDAWLARWDADGNRLWTQQFGTDQSDLAFGVALDGQGDIYVTGRTAGSLSGDNAGGDDVFLSKHDDEGNRLWIRQFGTPEFEEPRAIAVDQRGHVYLAGTTAGDLFGASGNRDVFVCKVDSDGNRIWATQLGTSTDNEANGIAIDGSDSVYITGSTQIAANGLTSAHFDPFLIRLSTSDGAVEQQILPLLSE